MAAGDQALGEEDVGADFVDVAGAAGVVAGGLDAARETGRALEADYVVGLPAVQGDGGLLQDFDSFVGVHAQGGVAFAGVFVGFQDIGFFHKDRCPVKPGRTWG